MTRGEDWVTALLSTWLVGGIFVDAWAHVNLPVLDTFFTPWHGVLYSGLAVSTVWLGITLRRHGLRDGRSVRKSVPVGYGTAVVGILMFIVGGIGDLVWHSVLGIEVDLEALLSPTHLTFFIGVILIAMSPLRSEWLGRQGSQPTLREFGPALLSTTLVVIFMLAAFGYVSPFQQEWIGGHWIGGIRQSYPAAGRFILYMARASGVAAILFYNLLIFAPILLLIKRWRLPFGTLTILFGAAVTSTLIATEFRYLPFMVVGFVAGLAGDALVARLKPGRERILATRVFAFVAPIIFWGTYVTVAFFSIGVGWPIELWTGSLIWTGVFGLALSALIFSGGVSSDPLRR